MVDKALSMASKLNLPLKGSDASCWNPGADPSSYRCGRLHVRSNCGVAMSRDVCCLMVQPQNGLNDSSFQLLHGL